MTIKEFYEWAVQNNAEDYELVNYGYEGKGRYDEHNFAIDHEEHEVYSEFEC